MDLEVERRAGGRLFHARGHATANARSPIDARRVGGRPTTRSEVDAERSWRRAVLPTASVRSDKYSGAVLFRQPYTSTHSLCWIRCCCQDYLRMLCAVLCQEGRFYDTCTWYMSNILFTYLLITISDNHSDWLIAVIDSHSSRRPASTRPQRPLVAPANVASGTAACPSSTDPVRRCCGSTRTRSTSPNCFASSRLTPPPPQSSPPASGLPPKSSPLKFAALVPLPSPQPLLDK